MRVLFVLFLISSVFTISADSFADYYPFAVGNYWIEHSDVYNGGYNPITFTMEIEAIEQIGGEDYFRRINHLALDSGANENTWYTWLRLTDEGFVMGALGADSLLVNATIFAEPYLLFSNEMANLGNTYSVEIPEWGGTFSYETIQTGATVTVPAGTFTNCLVISLIITDSNNVVNQETEFYFQYQLGEVRNYTWSAYYENMELELIEYNVQTSSPQIEIPVAGHNLHNYPNPFNPSTTICFETTNLHESARIEIYNLKGQKVKTLTFPSRSLGMSEGVIVWYGDDDNGNSVASGVYFYTLISEGKPVQTRKMVLMK